MLDRRSVLGASIVFVAIGASGISLAVPTSAKIPDTVTFNYAHIFRKRLLERGVTILPIMAHPQPGDRMAELSPNGDYYQRHVDMINADGSENEFVAKALANNIANQTKVVRFRPLLLPYTHAKYVEDVDISLREMIDDISLQPLGTLKRIDALFCLG